jgi:hypothetical protein
MSTGIGAISNKLNVITGLTMTDSSTDKPETTPSPPPVPAFLASRSGPFHDLQVRLGVLTETGFNILRRAVLFIGLAWFVPLLLSVPGSIALTGDDHSFLTDPEAWAKYFFAIGAFILADRQIELGLKKKLADLSLAPLVAPSDIGQLARLANEGQRLCASKAAEVFCVMLAYLASLHYWRFLRGLPQSTWEVTSGPGGGLTIAGWWVVLVSAPLFFFMLFRGLWRHGIWAWLLLQVSRMRLLLVASHPDGHAGLGFVGRYPNAYALFVLGTSAAVAASLAKLLVRDQVSITSFSMIAGGWLAIVLAVFGAPLLTFTRPLTELKLQGMRISSAQATRFQRQAERKALGRNVVEGGPDEGEDAGDPAKIYDAHKKLSTILVSRSVLVPISLCALLPFAAAASTELPYKEVWSVVKKLLLL